MLAYKEKGECSFRFIQGLNGRRKGIFSESLLIFALWNAACQLR